MSRKQIKHKWLRNLILENSQRVFGEIMSNPKLLNARLKRSQTGLSCGHVEIHPGPSTWTPSSSSA
eukprot:8560107-Pyramimonas_sp.AAC.1